MKHIYGDKVGYYYRDYFMACSLKNVDTRRRIGWGIVEVDIEQLVIVSRL